MKIKSIIQAETTLTTICFKTVPEMTPDLAEELNKKLKDSHETKVRDALCKDGFLVIPSGHEKAKTVEVLEKILTKCVEIVTERDKRKALLLKRYQDKLAAKWTLQLE